MALKHLKFFELGLGKNCLPIRDLVDSWPLLEIPDWLQNCCDLNRMLIQRKCLDSNGKLQCQIVPVVCQVMRED